MKDLLHSHDFEWELFLQLYYAIILPGTKIHQKTPLLRNSKLIQHKKKNKIMEGVK
jgi:hypothetical protein